MDWAKKGKQQRRPATSEGYPAAPVLSAAGADTVGSARHEGHESERPMAIRRRLEREIPAIWLPGCCLAWARRWRFEGGVLMICGNESIQFEALFEALFEVLDEVLNAAALCSPPDIFWQSCCFVSAVGAGIRQAPPAAGAGPPG
jgi:hypothetical protein